MAKQKILLPYNFTAQDQKAVAFTLQNFAAQPEAEVVLFHAHTPVPVFEMREDRVMEKLRGNLSYLNTQAAERSRVLQEVAQRLAVEGFGTERVRLTNKPRKKDVASEILECAQQEGCSVIVISRKPGKSTRFFTGSVHSKVIAGARDATVCIVT